MSTGPAAISHPNAPGRWFVSGDLDGYFYGFPKQRAAEIAVAQVQLYAEKFEQLLFVRFDAETKKIYNALLTPRLFR